MGLQAHSHLDPPSVLISNRDEYLKRPATPSQWHSFPSPETLSTSGSPSASIARHVEQPDIAAQSVLSGLDAHPSGGGTWLGLTRSGRLAAITNFTEAAPPPLPQGRGLDSYRSRGSLVRDWLKENEKVEEGLGAMEGYLAGVASHMDEWPGFNLLVGQIHGGKADLGYVSNRSGESVVDHLSSEPNEGANGMSNSCLRQPWDKVQRGRQMLDTALSSYDEEVRAGEKQESAEDALSQVLFTVLESKVDLVKREDFVRSIQISPIRLVGDAWYATRTATVLLVRRDGLARWWERDVFVLSPEGAPVRGEELHLAPRYFEWQIKAD